MRGPIRANDGKLWANTQANKGPGDVREAVEICSRLPRRTAVECAGGINLENVRAYAETGVDFISVGALTYASSAVDMSMRVVPA